MNCPFQKRAGEWGEFRHAKASGIGTRDRVSCLQKKRSEFELFTQIFFYILLKCQSITGFVRVLENLESPGISFCHFPGLESPGKWPRVLESPGNLN